MSKPTIEIILAAIEDYKYGNKKSIDLNYLEKLIEDYARSDEETPANPTKSYIARYKLDNAYLQKIKAFYSQPWYKRLFRKVP